MIQYVSRLGFRMEFAMVTVKCRGGCRGSVWCSAHIAADRFASPSQICKFASIYEGILTFSITYLNTH